VCKVSTRTTQGVDAVIRRHRGILPEEAATGVVFPFDVPRPRLVKLQDRTAMDNGFQTREAMDKAHSMVLAALETSPPQGLTVDLGCGNGHLMRRINRQFGVTVLGIESDAERAHGAEDILLLNLVALDSLPNADTFIVSQRRFEEIPQLESWVYAHARQVLVYSYDSPMFAKVINGRP